jgi:LPXTG-site transpeptidase (sortase) family protein
MRTQKAKLATLLLWGGGLLVLVGGGLSLPRLTPYVETLLYTQRIPPAPPFEVSVERRDLPATAAIEPAATPSPTPDVAAAGEVATATPLQAEGQPLPTAEAPTATPTEVWRGTTPVTLSIPGIRIEAPVVSIGWKIEEIGGQNQAIWDVPDWRAAGWHNTSVPLGVRGNTVLNGHNTGNGEVFRDLYKLEVEDEVFLTGENGEVYVYRIEEKYILREAGQPLSVRQENARYIEATPDERITFVTCHPYGSLANRLVVIAYPVSEAIMSLEGMN